MDGRAMAVNVTEAVAAFAEHAATESGFAGGVHVGRAPTVDPPAWPFAVIHQVSAIPNRETWLGDDGQADITLLVKVVGITRTQVTLADEHLATVLEHDRPAPQSVSDGTVGYLACRQSRVVADGVARRDGSDNSLWTVDRYWTLTVAQTLS